METKTVEGFEEYIASPDGHIYSLTKYRGGRSEIGYVGVSGYMTVTLRKDKKQKRFLTHKLIAEMFLDNPNGYPFVMHIDGNRQNNAVDNLQWCTKSMYLKHSNALRKAGKLPEKELEWE